MTLSRPRESAADRPQLGHTIDIPHEAGKSTLAIGFPGSWAQRFATHDHHFQWRESTKRIVRNAAIASADISSVGTQSAVANAFDTNGGDCSRVAAAGTLLPYWLSVPLPGDLHEAWRIEYRRKRDLQTCVRREQVVIAAETTVKASERDERKTKKVSPFFSVCLVSWPSWSSRGYRYLSSILCTKVTMLCVAAR